jgi:hypothetical protein
VRKMRLARIADREQIEMLPGAGEMEARGQSAPIFALMRRGRRAPSRLRSLAERGRSR